MRDDVKKGFTLIELLVVIAVIAIIAALLFPVFATAREKARQTTCLSNLRQIGAAVMLYVQDYDERFPGPNLVAFFYPGPEGRWDYMPTVIGNIALTSVAARLLPYVKSRDIFVEPSDPSGERFRILLDPRVVPMGYPWSVGLSNGWSWPDVPRLPGQFRDPQQPLSLAELKEPVQVHLGGDVAGLDGRLPHSGRRREEARWNLVYADGHVRFMRWIDDWLPEERRPWPWSVWNPRQAVDLEKPCTPTCAAQAMRE